MKKDNPAKKSRTYRVIVLGGQPDQFLLDISSEMVVINLPCFCLMAWG